MPRKRHSRRPKEWIPYFEKLKDPRWQLLRLEVYKRDRGCCIECGRSDRTLNVHHLIYLRGYEPWDYELSMLVTLCSRCHELRERAILEINKAMVPLSTGELILWAKKIRSSTEAVSDIQKRLTATAAGLNPLPMPIDVSQIRQSLPQEKQTEYFKRIREAIG
jgi:hypothetical protein